MQLKHHPFFSIFPRCIFLVEFKSKTHTNPVWLNTSHSTLSVDLLIRSLLTSQTQINMSPLRCGGQQLGLPPSTRQSWASLSPQRSPAGRSSSGQSSCSQASQVSDAVVEDLVPSCVEWEVLPPLLSYSSEMSLDLVSSHFGRLRIWLRTLLAHVLVSRLGCCRALLLSGGLWTQWDLDIPASNESSSSLTGSWRRWQEAHLHQRSCGNASSCGGQILWETPASHFAQRRPGIWAEAFWIWGCAPCWW